MIIEDKYYIFHCFVLIGSVVGFFVCTVFFLLDLKKGVEFDSSSIKVMADPADKKGLLVRRFQHKVEIKYDEIEDIALLASNTDSRGRAVENVFVLMPYINFICKNGKQKAINVHFYNKKQTIKIIDEAIRRAAEAGNVLDIESGEVLLKEFLQK